MKLLNTEAVILIHKAVISPKELQGLAGDKSLDAIIGRVENRIHYGIIQDEYDLASTYAVVIARGHIFNDANKRTAFKTMKVCLQLNNIFLSFDTESMGQAIIKAAQGWVDEVELARYLRNLK